MVNVNIFKVLLYRLSFMDTDALSLNIGKCTFANRQKHIHLVSPSH